MPDQHAITLVDLVPPEGLDLEDVDLFRFTYLHADEAGLAEDHEVVAGPFLENGPFGGDEVGAQVEEGRNALEGEERRDQADDDEKKDVATPSAVRDRLHQQIAKEDDSTRRQRQEDYGRDQDEASRCHELGMINACPICRGSPLKPLASLIAASVTPKRTAIVLNVSPATTV